MGKRVVQVEAHDEDLAPSDYDHYCGGDRQDDENEACSSGLRYVCHRNTPEHSPALRTHRQTWRDRVAQNLNLPHRDSERLRMTWMEYKDYQGHSNVDIQQLGCQNVSQWTLVQ